MTLSTRAEHAFGDEVEYVTDETMMDVTVVGDVEDALVNAENLVGVTEDTPAVVDRKSVVDGARDARRAAVRSTARCFTDSDSVADAATRDVFDHVRDIIKHTVKKSPYLVADADVDSINGRVLINETEVDL